MEKRPNWSLKRVKVRDLKNYYKNPRQLSDKQGEQLKESIDKFGLIDKPIVNQDFTLIGGHQRKNVILGEFDEVDVWYPDRKLSESEVEELNIRLNKNTGSWDYDTLANEWEVNDLLNWGFEDWELGIKEEKEDEEQTASFTPKHEIIVTCSSEEHLNTTLSFLRDHGYDCKEVD